MSWVKNASLSIKILSGLLFLVYLAISLLKEYIFIELYMGLLFSTLIIPFSILAILVTESSIYKSLSDTKWTSILMGLAIAIYLSLANIWAGVEVNRIFEISPGNLPYTTTALTLVYFLNTIMLPLAQFAFYAVFALSSFWIIYVLVIDFQNIKAFGKRVLYAVLTIFYVGTVMGGTSGIDKTKDSYAIKIALFADFNKYHRCTEQMPKNLEGVIFLSSGSVLTSEKVIENGKANYEFNVLPCKPI
ncbi:hypothetical protein CWB76_09400 [Pseudoalteromonas sp. S1609]|uniref:hypothetical protein n=1 Tax=Pseudoalteromonas sp. S1609 TaxID=579505 RepID=UPI00110B18D0|nr:hypothetical protein [Pseudoalteromonas sp. S1609]TMP70771.1 hypothetical protein CWB76_09400 [Pseudoalteromonas sp. S1609]